MKCLYERETGSWHDGKDQNKKNTHTQNGFHFCRRALVVVKIEFRGKPYACQKVSVFSDCGGNRFIYLRLTLLSQPIYHLNEMRNVNQMNNLQSLFVFLTRNEENST